MQKYHLIILTIFSTLSNVYGQNQISPKGKILVSYEERGDQTDIYIQPFNGEKQYITKHPYFDYNPQWSASGEEIIFYRKHPTEYTSEVLLYSIADKHETQLLDNTFYNGDPSLSKDSKLFAFSSKRDGNFDIYKMDLATKTIDQLTFSEGNNWGPSWSPDNKQIVFTSDLGGNFELHIVSDTGSELTQLTKLGGENYKPDWSPDGKWIAFFHRDNQEAKFDLMLISTFDNTTQNITNTPGKDEYTCGWGSNSKEVFFYQEDAVLSFHLISKTIKTHLK